MTNVLDFHTHIFPEPIAAKATDNVGSYYSIHMHGNGTLENLSADLKKGTVTHSVIFSSATKARQVESVNNFVAENVKKYDCFFGFGTLHQDYENVEAEVARIKELGLLGVKLHPDFQKFYIDEPKMYRIYEQLEGKLPVLLHTGDVNTEYSKPQRLKKVLHDFPKLTVIAAHMGGYGEWELAKEYLFGENVYLDTSSCFIRLSPEEMKQMIRAHGADRIVFGSDYPHQLPTGDYAKMLECGLTQEEYGKIFWENGMKILG